MATKITPSKREVALRKNDFIVSKTDNIGRLTYCNPIFIEFSGYTEHELLGKQHNIIRHPDMPRAVFSLLWKTVQSGEEFMGYVKNLCKDGSYYWVYATVTPSYEPIRTAIPQRAQSDIETVTVQMQQVKKFSNHSSQIAANSSSSLVAVIENLTSIIQKIDMMKDSSLELSQSCQAITDVTTLIAKIADQTNLLALNAALPKQRRCCTVKNNLYTAMPGIKAWTNGLRCPAKAPRSA